MITIYDLLEIEEDASKEEIEEAYNKILYKYRQDPNFSEETNQQNEMIVNKIKIAYEILSNDEKRKKYDSDLSKKRAESLLKGLEKNEESKQENEKPQFVRPKVRDNNDADEEEEPIKAPNKKEKCDFDDGDVHNLIPAGLNGCLTLCTASPNLTGGSCAVAAWDQEEWSCSRHISVTGRHQDALHPSLVCPQKEWG